MSELIDKAVWVEDIDRARNVIWLVECTYPGPEWTGAMLFQDAQGGLVLVCCFDPELYPGALPAWEVLFPARDLRELTMSVACSHSRRFRPYLAGGVALAVSRLKLLPG